MRYEHRVLVRVRIGRLLLQDRPAGEGLDPTANRPRADIRGAIREGMAALSLSPGDPDSLHAVGLAYQARGDDLAARKYLEAFLATGPELEVSLEVRALLATLEGAPKPPEGDDD